MPVISDKPADLKPVNDLDNIDIPEDLLGPVPAAIELSGLSLLVMDKPPKGGEFVKIEVTLRCREVAEKYLTGGETAHVCRTTFISAKATTEPYKPEPDPKPEPKPDPGPALLDRAGNIPADDDEEGGQAEDLVEDAEEDGGLNEFDPEFSHNGRGE